MPSVQLSEHARQDLIDIWLYIAEDSVRAADKTIDRITTLCDELAGMPTSGRPREEFAAGLRSYPAGRYLVFYMPDADGISVVRIVSGERDLPTLFGGGDPT
jgi:toxin ParE1/3/4